MSGDMRPEFRGSVPVELEIAGVRLQYGAGASAMVALEDVSLDIGKSEFIVVVGASGCGKSSLLNLIAGFFAPSHGTLRLDGAPILGPGADRGVVFQEHALFPWMTVRQNIAYGLKVNGASRTETKQRVDELLDMIGLARFAEAWPKALSGGMKQRVAIARALANRPKVLLMDEPFAALDAQTRRFLQDQVLKIWERTGTTIVFITHSIDEAVLLADRIVVMKSRPGRIKEIIDVGLARPRNENELNFLQVRRRISESLQEEIDQSRAIEQAGEAD
jgi:NitT/TauT family transport system ATP-binding protein